jgi:flagellar hook-associated protein 3 FlgL
MRVSTAQVFTAGIRLFGEKQNNLARYEQQIGTGKKLTAPEDDPIAAARIVEIEAQLGSNAQYGTNVTYASSRLSQAETALNGVNDALQRIQDLAIQGRGMIATNSGDRATIADEIALQLQQIVQLGNYQDGNGEYLFGGSKTKTLPFIQDADGSVIYAGDQGARQLQISDTRHVQDSDSGFDVFMSVRAGNGTFTATPTAANTGTGVITTGSILDPTKYVAEPYTINFTSPTTYSVEDSGGTTVSSGTYTSGRMIAFGGLQTSISGTPAAGDSFSLVPSPRQSVFGAVNALVEQFRVPLSTGTDRAKFDNHISRALADLDQSMEKVNTVRSSIGVRQRGIDTQQQATEDYSLELTKVRSTLEDVDIVEATSLVTREATALQVAQQAFAKMQSLSLFNYLN